MTRPLTVHIIDDEEAIRSSLGFLLKAAGYNARGWSSGVNRTEFAGGCLV